MGTSIYWYISYFKNDLSTNIKIIFIYITIYFSDVNGYEVMLRKVITIQDLTLCLDKMDASGKIEIYQVLQLEIYI